MVSTKTIPLFPLGQTLATPGALELLTKLGLSAMEFLQRHYMGDWGEIHSDDVGLNEAALKDGSRIMSVYKINQGGHTIWIITEAADENGQRAATTVLLPSEY